MELKWTSKALADLVRLHGFLAPANKAAAARTVQALAKAPATLLTNPRIGEQLFEFAPREVRRILVGRYEVRYEIQGATLYVLRRTVTQDTVSTSTPAPASHGLPGGGSMGAHAIFQPKPRIPEDLLGQSINTSAKARFRIAADGSAQVDLVRPTDDPRLNEAILRA